MRAQKTLCREVIIEGVGVHTGEKSRLVCRPAKVGAGVVLTRVDLPARPKWNLTDFSPAAAGTGRRTILAGAGGSVETVEHFLAALWALGIANLDAELTGPELPILDGSASGYVEALTAAGLESQDARIREVCVTEPIFVSGDKCSILALPHDGLRVTYTLDYPYAGLTAQTVSFDLTPEVFLEAIVPARTFCAQEEAVRLREQGYGKGATTQNTLVMTADGPLENTLRFKDECARHKVLDLIGDLGLLGADIRAQIVAVRSGHALNHRLLEKLAQIAG